MEELKNDINYYEVLDFTYTVSSAIENTEDYKDKLSVFLNANYGGNWSIYHNNNGSITCIKAI